jgi:hypothetical protein
MVELRKGTRGWRREDGRRRGGCEKKDGELIKWS